MSISRKQTICQVSIVDDLENGIFRLKTIANLINLDILPIPQADADFQLSIISESLFQHLVSSLNPFDTEESIVSGKFDRTFQILKVY